MGQGLCEWGLRGVEALRDRVAALVIVDVLSFSTAVDVALASGALVIPFSLSDRATARVAAAAAGAVLAKPREAGGADFSLSPPSLVGIPRGTRLLLPSPNGSRLSLAGGAVPVFTGCLRNAEAVAAAAAGLGSRRMEYSGLGQCRTRVRDRSRIPGRHRRLPAQ